MEELNGVLTELTNGTVSSCKVRVCGANLCDPAEVELLSGIHHKHNPAVGANTFCFPFVLLPQHDTGWSIYTYIIALLESVRNMAA